MHRLRKSVEGNDNGYNRYLASHVSEVLEETHIFSEPCCEGTDAARRETPIDVNESLGMSKRSMSNKLESRIAMSLIT